jgi:hypothetical protein
MTLRNQIIEQLGGRLFTATFTKLDGSIRQAYGQIVRDDRLTDDHPNVITLLTTRSPRKCTTRARATSAA